MAYHKKEEFSTKEQSLAALAKAISHPARLSILNILCKKNDCICGDIVDLLPLAQSTVSQHLKELKEAGLIKGETDGPKTCYCINWDTINHFQDEITKLFSKLKSQQSKCC